jgi:hypothetical protein
VKQKKITRNESKGQDKNRENNWKSKALSRSKENIALRKRIKEVTESRDRWKLKHQTLQQHTSKTILLEGETAFGHQYSLVFVALLLEFYKYGGMSLRSCRHCISCMLISIGLSGRVPSHNSIRNWACKAGFNRIEEGKCNAGNYVLYVDESIVFGSEKILLIIGVEEKKIPTDRALTHQDMEVLYVGASTEWKGETIEEELRKIALNKGVKYVVSDEGNNLRKAYKSLNYNHIEDCTHVLANHLKRLYEKEEDFKLFRKLIGELRQSWNLSKINSRYMPPSMRGKLRFANIFPCVEWAEKSLENWANLSVEVQESLAFLKANSTFIKSLIEVSFIFKTVCKTLKEEGFGTLQKQAILAALAPLKGEVKTNIFIENCKDYLENLTQKSKALKQKHLLCSSDIIESYFGKFKTKINSNNRSGLTEFIFTIANFSQPFSVEEVKNALENVKLKDLKLAKKQPNSD